MRRTPALIVGGGPAGAAAAITLARGGARARLFERQAQTQDALCGGFLSWRTLATIDRLGIDSARLGGHPIDRVALFSGNRRVAGRLPDRGVGLSRRHLDSLLLEQAERCGAAIERGTPVRAAVSARAVRLAGGEEIAGDALFLATGKHDLRGLARPAAASGEDSWMGLRFRLAASPGLADTLARTIELHLFSRGYAGLLLQEDGSANLCLAARKSRLAEAGGDPQALLTHLAADAPALGARIDAAAGIMASDAIGLVPYGWRATRGEAGLFRIGDQAAVIPSLAGEGVGIALASGVAAARAYLAGGPQAAAGYQRRFARSAQRPMALASLLKALAERPALTRPGLALARLPGVLALVSRLTRISA